MINKFLIQFVVDHYIPIIVVTYVVLANVFFVESYEKTEVVSEDEVEE